MKGELRDSRGGKHKMVKCIFCGKEEHAFIGIHLFKNDGSTSYFCSSKCRQNTLKLGRDKRRVGWTEAYREKKGKAEYKAVPVVK